MKNAVIIALGVGAVALFYMAYKKSQEEKEVKKPVMPPAAAVPTFTCPEGEIKCDKKDKCYNPVAKYIVDPCM